MLAGGPGCRACKKDGHNIYFPDPKHWLAARVGRRPSHVRCAGRHNSRQKLFFTDGRRASGGPGSPHLFLMEIPTFPQPFHVGAYNAYVLRVAWLSRPEPGFFLQRRGCSRVARGVALVRGEATGSSSVIPPFSPFLNWGVERTAAEFGGVKNQIRVFMVCTLYVRAGCHCAAGWSPIPRKPAKCIYVHQYRNHCRALTQLRWRCGTVVSSEPCGRAGTPPVRHLAGTGFCSCEN